MSLKFKSLLGTVNYLPKYKYLHQLSVFFPYKKYTYKYYIVQNLKIDIRHVNRKYL